MIDRLLAIKAKYPNLVECTTNALELLRSENCRTVTDNCLAASKMASWDVSGNRKEKCILGPKADCDRCGCAVPFWLHSFEEMDDETMGKMFGQAAGKYVKFIRPLKYLRRKASPPDDPPAVLHQITNAKHVE